jgi:A/G-specific adenine glycosylase
VREAAVVVRHRGKVFLRRRAPGERWAGYWDFPRFPLDADRDDGLSRELARKVREHTGLVIGEPTKIATIKHGVTRFRITLDCYQAQARRAASKLPRGDWQWLAPGALGQLALSMTGRKLSRLIDEAD